MEEFPQGYFWPQITTPGAIVSESATEGHCVANMQPGINHYICCQVSQSSHHHSLFKTNIQMYGKMLGVLEVYSGENISHCLLLPQLMTIPHHTLPREVSPSVPQPGEQQCGKRAQVGARTCTCCTWATCMYHTWP